jgi:hypothetical protein
MDEELKEPTGEMQAPGAVAAPPVAGTEPDKTGMTVSPEEEAAAMEVPEETNPIAQYFPNVTVTEDNRAELESAAAAMQEHEQMMPLMERYQKANRELAALFASEPGVQEAILEWQRGSDFASALSRYIDLEAIVPQEGEPNYDAYSQNRQKRLADYDGKQKRLTEQQENEKASIQALQEFVENKGMGDEDAQGFMNYLLETLDAAFSGRLTPELINRMYMAMNYDSDKESAQQEGMELGELKGRNAKISDLKEKSAAEPATGLPDISEGGAGVPGTEEKKKPMFRARSEFRV